MLTDHLTNTDYTVATPLTPHDDHQIDGVIYRPNELRPVDELANFVTHGAGLLLSIAGAALMVQLALIHPDPWLSVACVVYCASLVSLYAASTLSHAFYSPARRRFYRTLDQACIFLLISGSFTPFAAMFLRHGIWPLLLPIMWGLALTGAFLVFRWGYLSATAQKLYVAMGWLPAISLPVIISHASLETVLWVVSGGVLYTAGTLFLWNDHVMKYFHAVWHLFVIAGSAAQYMAIHTLLTMN